MRLYLASRSPRRRELLHQMGIDFDTLVFRDGMRADFEIDETPHQRRAGGLRRTRRPGQGGARPKDRR
jgi:predicted house-cleaning NTP pyrophosphatase (Maf/HAM1 superfamily)